MKYTTCTFYQCIILLYNVAQKSWLLSEQFNLLILVVACRIGLQIGLDRITNRIGLAIRLTFKVTLKVIAFWLL